MKILHTADWHLGTFRSPVKDGVNLRTEDTKRCLDELIRVANEEKPAQEQPQSQPTTNGNETTGYFCDGCGAEINERVYEYSLNKFGRPLCMKCQKGAGK